MVLPKNFHHRSIGTKVEVFYKKGNWLEKLNGKQFNWRLFLTKENRVYKANTYRDEKQFITWMHGGYLQDVEKVLQVEVNRHAEEILGHDCNQIILYTKQDTFQYFFSNDLPVNYRYFEKCRVLCFNVWTRYAQAMPLKMVFSRKSFGRVKYTMTATSIQSMSIDNRVFTMPIEGRKTKPNWGKGHLEYIKYH